ncbi:hypothetical protein [Streptomyces sp. NPDC056160]|uniref:hypothetical protein n=1 Tax=Streptomyces sp. NPDC056160 TaxID=3345731 RepID=UPI0035E049D6
MPVWVRGRGGRPEDCFHRQLFDAIRSLGAGGTSWGAAQGLPGWGGVYGFIRRRRELLMQWRGVYRDIALDWPDGGWTGGLVGWYRDKLALPLRIVERIDDLNGVRGAVQAVGGTRDVRAVDGPPPPGPGLETPTATCEAAIP